jgi:hypothetical protein
MIWFNDQEAIWKKTEHIFTVTVRVFWEGFVFLEEKISAF